MKKQPKHHIALVWRKLDNVAGGVENFSINLANEMVRRGHAVSFFTWDEIDARPFFPLDDRVNWIKLDLGNPDLPAKWSLRLARFFQFRRNVRQASPDVILVFESGIFLVVRLFLLALTFRIVLAERNSPSKHKYLKKRSKIFSVFGHYFASEIVFQFSRYKEFLPHFLRHKVVALPNPVISTQSRPRVELDTKNKRKSILFIGRLAYQKNVGALINAFLALAEDYPDWDLIIGGGGPEKTALCRTLEESVFSDRVFFVGPVDNPQILYSMADIFCIPSFYEGFPNTLAEALAAGLPSVGFKDGCGVTDLIQDGINGLLSQGAMTGDKLQFSLEKLMYDSQLRGKMKDNSKESVLKFNPSIVYNSWEIFLVKGHHK
jgi:glycosyltransferase involved in cell wall biosynthesis